MCAWGNTEEIKKNTISFQGVRFLRPLSLSLFYFSLRLVLRLFLLSFFSHRFSSRWAAFLKTPEKLKRFSYSLPPTSTDKQTSSLSLSLSLPRSGNKCRSVWMSFHFSEFCGGKLSVLVCLYTRERIREFLGWEGCSSLSWRLVLSSWKTGRLCYPPIFSTFLLISL